LGLTIVGAAIGDCVHVAGVLNFLSLAEEQGYKTVFLGPAVSIDKLLGAVRETHADLVAVGYRLSPIAAERTFSSLKEAIKREGLDDRRYIFGGTPSVADVAKRAGIFEAVFSGKEDIDEIIAFLKGKRVLKKAEDYPQDLISRIGFKDPYPLLRHHFGLPSLQDTIEGARRIAEESVLDVLSIGPDQNAQERFFRPDEMDHTQDGAGGVPIRSREDLGAIYEATRTGNFPLLRCYSGTRDLLRMAKMLHETINNAWAAIPLFWYSELDGRSDRTLREALSENLAAMRWHAEHGIPVEVNEAHHWSLRDAPDPVAVAAAYLAAYNAKKQGVRHYVAQYMFNTPPGTSAINDLGKMAAKIEMIESLHDDTFTSIREVRAGLSSFPADLELAKGQLAYSTFLSMALKPKIVHVVGYSEGVRLAGPDEVIQSCKIVRGVIRNTLQNIPDMLKDVRVQARKEQLLAEAETILGAIRKLGANVPDPLADTDTLAAAVEVGILDAPHLKGGKAGRGISVTRMVNGACVSVNPRTGRPISEASRIAGLW